MSLWRKEEAWSSGGAPLMEQIGVCAGSWLGREWCVGWFAAMCLSYQNMPFLHGIGRVVYNSAGFCNPLDEGIIGMSKMDTIIIQE